VVVLVLLVPSYAARTRARNALSASTRKPEWASSAAVRRAAVCAASVRAALAKPGVWFFASSRVGMAVVPGEVGAGEWVEECKGRVG
jgi:hypothetical protein